MINFNDTEDLEVLIEKLHKKHMATLEEMNQRLALMALTGIVVMVLVLVMVVT